MSQFTIFPAIDLRGGQVVRLRQGDPARQTVYGMDPSQVAARWMSEGAEWLHVVNLDGAFGEAARANREALHRLVHAYSGQVNIQLGGGIRTLRDVEQALATGVARVVIGTAAIEDADFAARAVERFGAQAAFALDAAGEQLRTHGWLKTSGQTVSEFGAYLASCGAGTVVYTDISRDGMGTGVNWRTAAELARSTGLSVIASGGVASLADVLAVKSAGLAGVIIGRALYDARISLAEALAC